VDLPRSVTALPLYPGARADVAVRCDGTVSNVTVFAAALAFPSPTVYATYEAWNLNISSSGVTAQSVLTAVTVIAPLV
jgi:hypothetical protein